MQLARLPLVMFRSSAAGAVLAGVALATFTAGCAYGNVRQVLRAQFASEIGCADVTIKKRDFWYATDNPHQYKISGCGVLRTYTCTKEDTEGFVSYDEPACKWEEGDADAPKPQTQAPADPMDGDMEGEGESMDQPMDAPASGEPSAVDVDAELDAEGAAPKGKVKTKGGLRLGSD